MRKKFAVNLVFLMVANLLVKPFYIFGIDRVMQNRVGAVDYGIYFAVFNYSFLFSIILDFGINNFNSRAISRNKNRLNEYLVNLMMIKVFLSIIYLVVTFISASITGFKGQHMWMLFVWAINQILVSIILYFRSNIAALQLFKTDSIISIMDRLLAIIFCMVLLYHPSFQDSFNIMWFIYAQTAALFITAVIALAVIIGKTAVRFSVWKGRFTRMILLKSMPFALLGLLMGIYYRIDAVMIERMLPNGAHEAGVYAASFRLLDAVNMFGYLFATLLLPLFATMIRQRETMAPLIKFSSDLMFVLTITVGINCYFFSDHIMHLLYPDSNAYWSAIFGWLMLNFIPMGSIYIYGTLLTAKGSLKALNIIALSGAIINIVINLFLIPSYGALGATFATLITQIICAIAHVVVANRHFRFEYTGTDLLRTAAYTIGCTLFVYCLQYSPANWLINFAAGCVMCGLLSLGLRLVPLNDLRELLLKKAT